MNKILVAVLFVLPICEFNIIGAQRPSSQPNTGNQAANKIVPVPTYTYTDKWFGFVTSSIDIDQGYKITPDAVRKSVTEKGARYVLYNSLFRRLELDPQERAAPFAGKQVWVSGSITSNRYGTGPTVEQENGAARGSGGRTIKITSITLTVNDTMY